MYTKWWLVVILWISAPASAQIITTIAGIGPTGPIGSFSGDGGPATLASLNLPKFVTVDTAGNLFIADLYNYRIRRVNKNGFISTYAGTGLAGSTGDGGAATSAKIDPTSNITHDLKGNIYFIDFNKIRKINQSGTIFSVAGNGIFGNTGDGGPATNAEIIANSVTCDVIGNLFLACGPYIRKVDTNGIISTIAGNGISGNSGNGGPSTTASISAAHIAIDTSGNIYISEITNNDVRKITREGIIYLFAGTGISGFSGDSGPATNAELNGCQGVTTDKNGNVYIVDCVNQRIREVTPNGIIFTIAGNGSAGFAGDGGAATAAELNGPIGISTLPNNDIIIADAYNNRIRKVTHNPTGVPEPTQVAEEVVLAPNPAPAGRFSVRLPAGVGMASMVITNTTGQTVLRQSLPPGNTSPINLNAPPGLYFVTITTPGNRWVEKVVVE